MDLRIAWLALGAFAVGVDGFVIGSLLPAIALETRGTIAHAGYVAFGYSLTMALGIPVLLAVIGAVDRRLVLTLASLVFALGALGVAMLPGLAPIIASRVVIAVGAGVYTAMGQAAAMAMAPPGRRGRAVTTMLIGTGAAIAIGVPAGAWIGEAWGWRTTYLVIAVLGLLSSAMLWALLPRGMVGARRTLGERLAVVALPGVPPLLATTGCMMLGGFLPAIYIAPLTTGLMGFGKGTMPAVLLAYGLGAVSGNIGCGRLIDRHGAYPTAVAGGCASVLALAAMPAVAVAAAGIRLGLYLLVVFAFAVGGWTFHAAQVTRAAVLSGEQAPLGISLNATAINRGSGLAAVIGGALVMGIGPIAIPWAGAALSAVALAILVASQRPATVSA